MARIVGAWLRRDLLVVTVDGASMEPALAGGDVLLCSRRTTPTRGAIVVRRTYPGGSRDYYQIKRLLGMPGDTCDGVAIGVGAYWIEGDNKTASADSRQVGPVPSEEIVAVALGRLRAHELEDLSGARPAKQPS